MNNLEYVQRVVDAAKKAGADFAEASIADGRHISVEVEAGSIRSTEAARTDALLVRTFVNGGNGTLAVSGLAARGISPEDAAREAVEMAKSADSDPDFVSLPAPEDAPEIEGLYDERLAEYSPADAVKVVGHAVDAARAVASDALVMADISVSAGSAAIANSLGVALERRKSSIDHGVFCVVRRDGDTGAFYDFDAGNTLDDVSLAPVAESAARQALTFLGSRKIETKSMPVILGPLSAYSFLKSIAGATNAESIQRKRSYLVGKLGEKIGSDLLTVRDDAFVPRGLASGAFDGEGAKRWQVTIFEGGRFNEMLHNSYTAHKAGAANNGHATRGGGISPTNVFIALGDRTAAEIIAETKEALYINMGSLSIHSASGDISTSVDFGYKIENGRMAYPVANAMVAGHIFDLLASIDAVSSDYRAEPGTIMPTIRIARLDVSG